MAENARNPVPDGFILFADIPEHLDRHKEVWPVLAECWRDRLARPLALVEVLARELAYGHHRAAGIDANDGTRLWAPPETWLISPPPRKRPQIILALDGQKIWVPTDDGRRLCEPFLSLHALAVIFGAKNPPPPPQSVLDSIQGQHAHATPPIRPASRAAVAQATKEKLKASWVVRMRASPDKPTPKEKFREEAELAGTVLTDEAFNSLWKDAVKEAGTTKWSDPGRRPKPGGT
jgi:hypothetical protein